MAEGDRGSASKTWPAFPEAKAEAGSARTGNFSANIQANQAEGGALMPSRKTGQPISTGVRLESGKEQKPVKMGEKRRGVKFSANDSRRV